MCTHTHRVRGERGRAWAAPPTEAAVRASRQPSCDRATDRFLSHFRCARFTRGLLVDSCDKRLYTRLVTHFMRTLIK